jgi:arylformamidase
MGEAVYRGMGQAALDAQYEQRTLVPRTGDYMARWAARSAALRRTNPPRALAYGEHPDEILDLYPGPRGAPVHLHIHGGAWRAQSRRDVGFVAAGLGPGATVAVAGFSLAPAVHLRVMVDQVRRAALALLAPGAVPGAPPGLVVSAHSSGAHLAACLLDPAWQAGAGLGPGAIRGMVLVSGLYDLEPVRLSARNGYLHLSPADVAALSPIRHLPDRPPPVHVLWGDGELAEFQRQSRDFAAALVGKGGRVGATCLSGCNHFDVCDLFGLPDSPVAAIARRLAGDGRG